MSQNDYHVSDGELVQGSLTPSLAAPCADWRPEAATCDAAVVKAAAADWQALRPTEPDDEQPDSHIDRLAAKYEELDNLEKHQETLERQLTDVRRRIVERDKSDALRFVADEHRTRLARYRSYMIGEVRHALSNQVADIAAILLERQVAPGVVGEIAEMADRFGDCTAPIPRALLVPPDDIGGL